MISRLLFSIPSELSSRIEYSRDSIRRGYLSLVNSPCHPKNHLNTIVVHLSMMIFQSIGVVALVAATLVTLVTPS